MQKAKEKNQKKKSIKQIEKMAQLHNRFKNDGSFLAVLHEQPKGEDESSDTSQHDEAAND